MKKSLGISLKIAISVLLIYYLFNKYDVTTIYRTFLRVKGTWIVYAFLCMIVSNLIGTLQWNLILKNLDIHLPFRRAFAYYFTGLFFNNFLLSFIGGDMVRIYDIRKTSGKNSAAVSAVLMDRLVGFLTLTSIAFLGIFYFIGKLDSHLVFLSIPVIFIIIIFVVLFLFYKPFAKRFESIGLAVTPERFHKSLREIYNSINCYGRNPSLLGKVFLAALCIQTARIFTHFCLSRSIGVSVHIAYFFLFIPAITLLISLPVTFGGIGMREWSAAVLFKFAAVSGEDAVLFEGLAYIVAILCSLPGGIAFVFRKH